MNTSVSRLIPEPSSQGNKAPIAWLEREAEQWREAIGRYEDEVSSIIEDIRSAQQTLEAIQRLIELYDSTELSPELQNEVARFLDEGETA